MIFAVATLLCRISDATEYQYCVPEQQNDGWTTADLRENFDVTRIEELTKMSAEWA
jgi:hypothetical protein